MDDRIRKIVEEIIKQELEEISASGAAGGYETPKAFAKNGEENKALIRKRLGGFNSEYTIVDDKDESNRVDEARSKYDLYKMDESGTVPQKIGRAITEINRRLNEIDGLLEMNERLKTENNLGSTGLWKRTMKHLTRMENKILRMSQRLKELKS